MDNQETAIKKKWDVLENTASSKTVEYFFHMDPKELEIVYSENEKLNDHMMLCFAEKGTSFH